MENQVTGTQDIISLSPKKRELKLPIIALLLDFAPLLFVFIASLDIGLSGVMLLGIVFSPVAGIMMGITSLCLGKERVGTAGVVLSIIAIALPIVFVASTVLLLKTGAVVIGM